MEGTSSENSYDKEAHLFLLTTSNSPKIPEDECVAPAAVSWQPAPGRLLPPPPPVSRSHQQQHRVPCRRLRPVCPWPCAGRAWRSSTIAASSGGGKTEAEGLPRAPAAVYGVPLALASLVYGTSVPLGFSSPSPSQEAPGRASLHVSPVSEGILWGIFL